jgi:Putative Actinobacterial Holin-X, holin superfamily III
MPENVQSDAPSMASLVGGIISDATRLVRQEIALARREMQAEFDKAKVAGVSLAAGAGLTMFGAVFLGLMVVFLLHEVGGLPLWASFLIVGGVVVIAGAILLYAGIQQFRKVSLVPPQTAETLQENVQWLQNPNQT